MRKSKVVAVKTEIVRPLRLKRGVVRMFEAFQPVTDAALEAQKFEMVNIATAMLHVIIVVDTSPSVADFVEVIRRAVKNLIQGVRQTEATNVIITVRGLHNSIPWISAAPIGELTDDLIDEALLLYVLENGTPLFQAGLEVCAFALAVHEQMRKLGVRHVDTQVNFLSDAENNRFPHVADGVYTGVTALRQTGHFTFSGIGVGWNRAYYEAIFKAMGLDIKDISNVADATGILVAFQRLLVKAIAAVGRLAIAAA